MLDTIRPLWHAGSSYALSVCLAACAAAAAPEKSLSFPPTLPGGKRVATDSSPEFLKPTKTLRSGVAIAKSPPTVDFLFYPGQDYPGRPWSVWGDGLAVGGRYYSSIGDHLAPSGNALVLEYDPGTRQFRELANLKRLLKLPEGHYAPGKIHGRLDLGDDGRLYFATHRGSTDVTSDKYHYLGDWIACVAPSSGKAEAIARGPVPKHCIPASVLDPKRLIFYGGTAAGSDAADKRIQFFAYDVKARRLLGAWPDGPSRAMIFAPSTGRVYFVPGNECTGPLLRYDPATGGPPVEVAPRFGLRAATQETPQGIVYAISKGSNKDDGMLWSLDTKTERVEEMGTASVGLQSYTASIDADPTGRYLYYAPGAHGGSESDGTPVVQYDLKTRKRKVIAFLHPFFADRYGCTLQGTFGAAVDPAGDKYYVTWNVSRSGRIWDCCAISVIHIPPSER